MRSFSKLILPLLLCFTSVSFTWAQNTFYRKYNLGGMQGGLQLEATNDGGFVATGQHEGNGSAGSCDIYVYRVDACGNNLWFKLYGNGSTDGGKSIKQVADGGYIVAGHYDGGTGFMMKIDDGGAMEWIKSYSQLAWVLYADEMANGDIIAMGIGGASALYIMRTTATGNVIWSKQVVSNANGVSMGSMSFYCKELSNGDVIFTSSYGISGKDVALGRITGSGNFLWGKAYGGTGWGDSDHTAWSCKGLVDEEHQSIIITSPTYAGAGGEDILLISADLADGSVNWAKTYGGSGSDQSREIAHHPYGYAVVGNSSSFPVSAASDSTLTENLGERDILLVNVDYNGDLRWARTYGGSDRDKGIGVKYNIDNGFTMSAYSNSPFFNAQSGPMDPVFIKTDSLGFVTCQVHSPPIVEMDLNVATIDVGALNSTGITAGGLNPTVNNYVPNDIYICQDCYTEPAYQPSDSVVCPLEQVQFFNTTQIGLTCFQNWFINGQEYSGNQDTLLYQFAAPGVYPVELYSTCGSQDQTFITNIHVVATTITQTNQSDYNGFGVSCFGANDGYLNFTASGGNVQGAGGYTWTWNPSVSTGSFGNELFANDYTIIASDPEGCADTLQVDLTEPTPLVSNGTVTTDYNGFGVSCFGSSDGALLANTQGSVPPYQTQWSGGPAATSWNGVDAGTYNYTVTDANDCTTNEQVIVNQPQQISGDYTVVSNYNGYDISCFDGTDGAAVYNAEGGVQPFTITWNGVPYSNGQVMSNLNAQPQPLTLTDANGCPFQDQTPLQQPPAIESVTLVTTDYYGQDISCPDAADGGAAVQVNGGVQPYMFLWEDGSTSFASNADLDAGYATVQVIDDNGCVHLDSILLQEPTPIQLQATITSDYNGYDISCTGAADGSVASLPTGATPPYSVWWSNGDTGNLSSDLPAGVIQVYATDVLNCDTAMFELTLNEPTPLINQSWAISDYNGYQISCYDGNDGAAAPSMAGSVPPYQYQWSNGSVGSAINAVEAGEYVIEVTDANGCSYQETITLTQPPPILVQETTHTDTCEMAQGWAAVHTTGGVPPYQLQWSESSTSDTLYDLLEGIYSYLVTDANACIKSGEITVANIPSPQASFDWGYPPLCAGQTIAHFKQTSDQENLVYAWNFGDGTQASGAEVTHVYQEPGGYLVTMKVYNALGCMTDTTAYIPVNPELTVFVPNAFTPDQDAINEGFAPVGEGMKSYEMYIFDRWGELIFETNEKLHTWNGSRQNTNEFSKQDVYVYRVIAKGYCEEKEFVGHVVLLR